MLSEISQIQKNRHCESTSGGSLEESGSQRQKMGNFVGTRVWGRMVGGLLREFGADRCTLPCLM